MANLNVPRNLQSSVSNYANLSQRAQLAPCGSDAVTEPDSMPLPGVCALFKDF